MPLSVTQSETIVELRRWANVRAVAATKREDLQAYATDPAGGDGGDGGDVRSSRGGRSLDF